MRKFFSLYGPYQFEMNDIFGPLNLINVILTINFGLITSWLGLAINITCLVDDLIEVRRLNLVTLHLGFIILNSYFLLTLYNLL